MNRVFCVLAAFACVICSPAIAHNGEIHEAPHGGIMAPTKNAHLEIVLAPKGGVRIYVYDLKNVPLPASAASVLSVEIERAGQKTEYVTLRPDPTGTLWMGPSKPVPNPASVIRIGSVVRGVSGLIEIPRSKFPVYKVAKGK
ncbi:hypothetical protein [Croceicoccus mobilis]|uniref:L,D-transpeptidase n=1 Tax=Croceicoccus mobilis TaxID=1703339 RepID=A0A916YXG6_9SPHN|nr:hypothetical protein [Croceicoccus mobilis]GGD65595.1 hypothetical protein GCM10010990_13860 [Croceicoccus mobilis]